MQIVKIKKISDDAIVPKYQHTHGDSGVDLHSIDSVTINPYERVLIHTGLIMAIPDGYEGCIRPRSGLALKKGLTVLNTPGTIDSNYRGEIGVILFNTSDEPVDISVGDRIAQMVFQELPSIGIVPVSELDETERGYNGFGSTGV